MKVLLILTVFVLAIAILLLVVLLWRRQGESSNDRVFLKVEAGPHGSPSPSARVTSLEEASNQEQP